MTSEAELDRAEQALALNRLPADYREWCLEHEGLEGEFGDACLSLYEMALVVELSLQMREFLPGVVVLGSDGGGELIALDGRRAESPIVMVPGVSSGWPDARVQAETFAEFMAQRDRGAPLRYDEPYDIR